MSDEKFSKVMPKIVPLLRMLSSNVENDIVNAARALMRHLAGADLDIHDLVERLEHGGNASLMQAEMQKIYDKGLEDGVAIGIERGRLTAMIATAQSTGTFAVGGGSGINGYSWLEIAQHLAVNKYLFNGKDADFVESMPEKILKYGSPRPKQADWLKDLFMRRFGGRIT